MDMAVKFVKGSETLVEGLAIPFGGPNGGKDLDGDSFGPDTNFVFEMYPHGRPVIYNHGMDGAMKVAVQGRQIEHEVLDEGIWARAQLDVSARYHATVARMVAQGKLFFSSGTAPQMVEQDPVSRHIKQWPWMELSLTPMPANPLAVVHAVKTAQHIDYLNAAGLDVPAELIATALKALDEPDSPPAPVAEPTYAELTELVAAHVKAWAKATTDRIEFRAVDGRRLTTAELERVREAHAVLTAAVKAASRTPEVEAEARAIEAEYLRLQSRMAGLPI